MINNIRQELDLSPSEYIFFDKAIALIRSSFEFNGNFKNTVLEIENNPSMLLLYKNCIHTLIIQLEEKKHLYTQKERLRIQVEISEKKIRNMDRELTEARRLISELKSR